MSNIKEEAQAYEPKQTLNITDLPIIDLSWPMEDRKGTDRENKEFTYKVIVVGEKEYRIAGVVLSEIKKMIKLVPELQFIKVSSTGSGKATRYEVEKAEKVVE